VPVQAAAADTWWKATSDHFIVYSSGSRSDAEELAVKLERVDEVERFMRRIKPDADQELSEPEKLTLYQFGETSDIGALHGTRGVAGFFIPRAGNSVAFVPLREDRRRNFTRRSEHELDAESVLFHEYTHYFMYQHAAAAYPFWYTEGFAELFATVELQPNGFRMGHVPKYRQLDFQFGSISMDRIIDPPDDYEGVTISDVYAGGWLLTSYLSLEPSRAGQLDDYLARINRGEHQLEAARAAFGDLNKLKSDVDAYRRGRERIIDVTFADYKVPTAEVSAVPEDIAESMMLRIRSQRGVRPKEAPALVPNSRELVAKYPESGLVLVLAANVELDAENLVEAQKLAERAAARMPDSAEPYLALARIAMRRAQDDPAELKTARSAYIAANNAEHLQAEALYGYYLTFIHAGEEPPENALVALDNSYRLAQFDDDIRQTLVWQLLRENRDREAMLVLGPLINQHGSQKERDRWKTVEKQLQEGQRAEAMMELAPKLGPKKDEEEN